MDNAAPDISADWQLPSENRPPLVHELEARIDEAMAVARASEAAAVRIGAAALDAAEQARRAATLAERASASMARPFATAPVSLVKAKIPDGEAVAATVPAEWDSLDQFEARADRVAARLRRLAGAV